MEDLNKLLSDPKTSDAKKKRLTKELVPVQASQPAIDSELAWKNIAPSDEGSNIWQMVASDPPQGRIARLRERFSGFGGYVARYAPLVQDP